MKRNSVTTVLYLFVLAAFLFLLSCGEIQNPKTQPYYAESKPPAKQELRWSNGKTPKSFDPAAAAAPPETDIVRAVFEGLTDTNSKSLEPVPAIATDWKSEKDFKLWTFELRKDAKWSNGETVTAEDFVRSWNRLAKLKGKVAHVDLLRNFSGSGELNTAINADEAGRKQNSVDASSNKNARADVAPTVMPAANSSIPKANPDGTMPPDIATNLQDGIKASESEIEIPVQKLDVEAVREFTLRIRLKKSDKDFPALVAHPMFRPVYRGTNFDKLNAGVVTNGAFRIASVGQDGITLDRSEKYWNVEKVMLERIRFVPMENAELALEAYRAGELDAVTNAAFEPLALKLLMPYRDFKRTVHSALNFYEINYKNKPFDDKRVREALAVSIERERLTEDDMDGSTKPAFGFQPFSEESETKISQDVVKGKQLLSDSGFPEGVNFPKIRLLVNRNNVQQKIARSVAKMWKKNLNVETEIIIKEKEEVAAERSSGNYDMIRRGVVLPTADETVNMMSIFSPDSSDGSEEIDQPSSDSFKGKTEKSAGNSSSIEKSNELVFEPKLTNEYSIAGEKVILTELEAIEQLLAIPLYFPTSYSLVKPYVIGFEINTLDATSLIEVSIDSNWPPPGG